MKEYRAHILVLALFIVAGAVVFGWDYEKPSPAEAVESYLNNIQLTHDYGFCLDGSLRHASNFYIDCVEELKLLGDGVDKRLVVSFYATHEDSRLGKHPFAERRLLFVSHR